MSSERGGALLEVIVALLILATAGSSLVAMVADGIHSVGAARVREAETDAAAQVMARLALRDARGLDIRLGRRVEGSFVTDVQRPRSGLYRLAVSDSTVPELELLVTVVHRQGAPCLIDRH